LAKAEPTTTPTPDRLPFESALPVGYRMTGSWLVTFQGITRAQEIYTAMPRCKKGSCDSSVQVSSYGGTGLGSGIFIFQDGRYDFEMTTDAQVTCTTPDGTTEPAVERTTTRLVVALFGAATTAIEKIAMHGDRVVALLPEPGSTCVPTRVTSQALGEPMVTAVLDAGGTPRRAATPAATPTPKPMKVAVIRPSFFGSGVAISTYRVTGATPYDISRSISARGPRSAWLGGRAAGLTKSKASYRWHMEVDWGGSCRIVREAKPAIKITFTIVLPRWKAGKSPAAWTVAWWNDEVRGIAKHERVHVDLYRAAQKKLNATLATSTCANVKRRLEREWAAAQRQNCAFDMNEYGTASGLSYKACLAR
jgi:predicted secreted Zn-dependent protease